MLKNEINGNEVVWLSRKYLREYFSGAYFYCLTKTLWTHTIYIHFLSIIIVTNSYLTNDILLAKLQLNVYDVL